MKLIPYACLITKTGKIPRVENACQFWWGERPRKPKANLIDGSSVASPHQFLKKDCPVSAKTGIYM